LNGRKKIWEKLKDQLETIFLKKKKGKRNLVVDPRNIQGLPRGLHIFKRLLATVAHGCCVWIPLR